MLFYHFVKVADISPLRTVFPFVINKQFCGIIFENKFSGIPKLFAQHLSVIVEVAKCDIFFPLIFLSALLAAILLLKETTTTTKNFVF